MDIDANNGTVHLGPLQMKILEFVATCVICHLFCFWQDYYFSIVIVYTYERQRYTGNKI